MIIGSIIASITDIICVSAATEQFGYQGMGMIVVFTCLSFLAIMISISGTVAQKMTNAKKAKEAAIAAAQTAAPAATAAAVAVQPQTGSNAKEVAALAAALYSSAKESLTPELIAVISAAVHTEMAGQRHRIVAIKASPAGYAAAGRSEIFSSHRIPMQTRR